MELRSKLGVENMKLALFALFYLITGVLNLAILAAYGFSMIHMLLLGFLSLVTAYGLFTAKKWVLWFAVVMFPIVLTDSYYILQDSITRYSFNPNAETLLFHIAFIIYPILAFAAFVYTAARRSSLK